MNHDCHFYHLLLCVCVSSWIFIFNPSRCSSVQASHRDLPAKHAEDCQGRQGIKVISGTVLGHQINPPCELNSAFGCFWHLLARNVLTSINFLLCIQLNVWSGSAPNPPPVVLQSRLIAILSWVCATWAASDSKCPRCIQQIAHQCISNWAASVQWCLMEEIWPWKKKSMEHVTWR